MEGDQFLTLAGWRVHIMQDGYTDYGAVARRIVRHGMKDILEWLGEEVGPSPDATTVYFSTQNGIMWVTQDVLNKLNRYVEIGVKIKMPHYNKKWASQNMYPDAWEGGIDVFSI